MQRDHESPDRRADAQTEESVRVAPSRFERWTNTNITGVSSSRLAPRWALSAGAISIGAMVVAIAVLRSGVAAAVLFTIGAVVAMVLFVSRWFVITAKARRYLVTRGDLGDWTRIAILAAIYVLIPVGTGLLLVAIVAVAPTV